MATKLLKEIENPRLQRLKQKTFSWRFDILHVPGPKLGAPDALSRNKAPSEIAGLEPQIMVQGSIPNPNIFSLRDYALLPDEDGEEVMSCKEARVAMLATLREIMDQAFTAPDPELDASGEILASMEMGIRSITWDMVKVELQT